MKRAYRGLVVGAVIAELTSTAQVARAQGAPTTSTAAPPPPPSPPAFPVSSGVTAPPPAPAPQPPAPIVGGCMKDIECKGDRICVAGQCVAPTPTAPVPAPLTPPPPSQGTTTPVVLVPNTPPANAPANAPPPAPTMVVLYTPPVEQRTASGLSVGLRLGVAFPGGHLIGNSIDPATKQVNSGLASDSIGVLVPITLDVGYRIDPHWYVGAYFSGAYGTSAASTCAEGGTDDATCYETDYRFGFDVQYNFFPEAKFQPWIGVGAGWEVLNSISEGADEESGSLNGVEFGHIDLGLDVRAWDRDKFGAYFLTSFAEYNNSYVHEFYAIGVRWRHDADWWHR